MRTEVEIMRTYQICEFIDGGGFADVFRVVLWGTTEHFAMKKLREFRDPEQRRRFAREVKMIQELKHDRIIKVVDANLDVEQPFYVMKLMAGGSLASWAGRLPIPNVRLILTQLVDALAYIHAHSGLHRDIKPENLLVDERGNFAVGDFGLGNNPRFTVMFTANAAGTWGYMAPELHYPNAVATPASDIYSAGATVFNLLTGVHPASAPMLDPARYRSDVPNDLRALILLMVAVDPRQRPTAAAVREALTSMRPVQSSGLDAMAMAPSARNAFRPRAPAESNDSSVLKALFGIGIFALIAVALSK
jgi:serine/threonine protein kinase